MGGPNHSEVEARFSRIRQKLDAGGYLESFGLDSLRLVEHLFEDLVKTTESLQKTLVEYSQYKKVAEELESGVAPFKEENVRLHRENSQLRIAIVKAFEEAEDKARDPNLRLRDLEAENNDLKLLVAQFTERIKRAEADSLEKTKRIIKLQEKELGPTVQVKGEVGKTPVSISQQNPSMEVTSFVHDACPQCIRLRNFVEYGKKTDRNPKAIDYMKLADSRIEALQLQLRSFKNLEKEHLSLISSLKSRVDTRESEIEKLRDLIKIRPGRDNKVNAALPSYKNESSDLQTELKSAEMQLTVLQRRNMELEEKLKKSILQEHQDYMLGKTSSFYGEGNVARIFLEKELDKYPSHDKMNLLEKLYYLERQLSHCCKEKAVLKLQIEECKLNHRFECTNNQLTMPTTKKQQQRPIIHRPGILRASAASSPYRLRPAKLTSRADGLRKVSSHNIRKDASIKSRVYKSGGNRGDQPIGTEENGKKSPASLTSDNEDIFAENGEIIENVSEQSGSDEGDSEFGDEFEMILSPNRNSPKGGVHIHKTNKTSMMLHKTTHKESDSKAKTGSAYLHDNTRGGRKAISSSSSGAVKARANQQQTKFNTQSSKQRQCESPVSAEYSNSDADAVNSDGENSENYDDNGNVNIEPRKENQIHTGVNKDSLQKGLKMSSQFSRSAPLKNVSTTLHIPSSTVHGRLQKNSQNLKSATTAPTKNFGRPLSQGQGTMPIRRDDIKPLNMKRPCITLPKQTIPVRPPGKFQKGSVISKSRSPNKITTQQRTNTKSHDEPLEDVEEEQEDFGELGNTGIITRNNQAENRAQRQGRDSINDRQGMKNISQRGTMKGENLPPGKNADAVKAIESTREKPRQAGFSKQQPKIAPSKGSKSTISGRGGFLKPTGEDEEALDESGAEYYDDDDELNNGNPSNRNAYLESQQGQTDSNRNDRIIDNRNPSGANAKNSKNSREKLAKRHHSDQLSRKGFAPYPQPSQSAGGLQGRIENDDDDDSNSYYGNDSRAEEAPLQANNNNLGRDNSSAFLNARKSDSFETRSQGKSSEGSRSGRAYKKAGEKDLGISAVKEPSLLSISEFERGQADEDYENFADNRRNGAAATRYKTQPGERFTKTGSRNISQENHPSDSTIAEKGGLAHATKPASREQSNSAQRMRIHASRSTESIDEDNSLDHFGSEHQRGFVSEREFTRGDRDIPVESFGEHTSEAVIVASYPRRIDDDRHPAARLGEHTSATVAAASNSRRMDDGRHPTRLGERSDGALAAASHSRRMDDGRHPARLGERTDGTLTAASHSRRMDDDRNPARLGERMNDDRNPTAGYTLRGTALSESKYAENLDDRDSNANFRTSFNPLHGPFHDVRQSVRSVGVNTENQPSSNLPWMDTRDDSLEKKSLRDKISSLQMKLDEVHAESSGHQLKTFELQGELERTKHMLQVEKQERDLAVVELKRVRELNNESTARMLMNSALGSDGSFRRGTTPMEMEREIVNLRTALASLDRDKDEMRVELDMKDEGMARLRDEASKYVDEISQLKLRLKNAELQINHTGESAKEQSREVEFLKKQLESNIRDLEKTIRQRDDALKDLHRLSAANTKGQMERRSVESELEQKGKEVETLRKQVQRYIDEVRRIEELLFDKEEELETLIQHYRALTHENNNLEAQRTSLEREASSIREGVRDAVDQNIGFKTQMASQNALIQSLEQEIENLTQQVSQLENQAESRLEKEKMLEADVKASKDLIYRLEIQMDKLKLDMADSESKRKQLEAENSELNAHIASLEARLNNETEQQQQLENLLANSREKDFQMERATQGISRERDELAEKLTSLQQRSETLNTEVSRYRLKSIELQSELDRTRRQLDNEKRDRETAIGELKRVREQLNSSSANYLLNTALGTSGSSGSQIGVNITDSSGHHVITTPSSSSTFKQNLYSADILQRGSSREQSPFATASAPFDLHVDPPLATSTSRRDEQQQPGPPATTSTSSSERKIKGTSQVQGDDEFEEWDAPPK